MFRAVCYRPDECQIITGGTDRKVCSLVLFYLLVLDCFLFAITVLSNVHTCWLEPQSRQLKFSLLAAIIIKVSDSHTVKVTVQYYLNITQHYLLFLCCQIGYWEMFDGSQIRELDGSRSASINGMDIRGGHFVTGGGDKLVKVSQPQVCK